MVQPLSLPDLAIPLAQSHPKCVCFYPACCRPLGYFPWDPPYVRPCTPWLSLMGLEVLTWSLVSSVTESLSMSMIMKDSFMCCSITAKLKDIVHPLFYSPEQAKFPLLKHCHRRICAFNSVMLRFQPAQIIRRRLPGLPSADAGHHYSCCAQFRISIDHQIRHQILMVMYLRTNLISTFSDACEESA